MFLERGFFTARSVIVTYRVRAQSISQLRPSPMHSAVKGVYRMSACTMRQMILLHHVVAGLHALRTIRVVDQDEFFKSAWTGTASLAEKSSFVS